MSVITAICSVAAGTSPYFLLQRLVVQILYPEANEKHLILLALIIGLSLILKSVLFAVSTTQSHKAAYRILNNIRLKLADKLTHLPMGYVLERDSGTIKKIMENDVEELERFLAHNIPETISSVIVPVAVLIYLFILDWRMALSFLVFIPFAVLFYHLMMKGKIYSISGNYKKYPKLSTATGYGTGAGLKGWNCRHDFYPFFEGISVPGARIISLQENQKEYENSQRQRSMERGIRQSKRS